MWEQKGFLNRIELRPQWRNKVFDTEYFLYTWPRVTDTDGLKLAAVEAIKGENKKKKITSFRAAQNGYVQNLRFA